MAFLRLDARHPECRGLAMALVGSPTNDENSRLTAVEESEGEWYFGTFCFAGKFRGCVVWDDVVFLPLDTLKLCPYVAMREEVRVVANGVIFCQIEGS